MVKTAQVQHFYLIAVAVIYFFAFSSLYFQIPGLYGNNGILPAHLQLKGKVCTDRHKECQHWSNHGECDNNPVWMKQNCPVSCKQCKKGESLPIKSLLKQQFTLLWFSSHIGLNVEQSMELLCVIGSVISMGVLLSNRMCNMFIFMILWVFYLSVYKVGQTFLWFQWDILLLETGFISIFLAPFIPAKQFQRISYHSVVFWLVKWLLFRLMYASGVVKLTSLCPTWWKLTALDWHYESQCIPTPLAWYAHQLPSWFQSLSVVAAYVIEIVLPFFFFLPIRSLRLLAFYGQLLLQVLIILTGNYNFFNLLTCTLCLSLIDDDHLEWWKRKSLFFLSVSSDVKKTSDDTAAAKPKRIIDKVVELIKTAVFYGVIIYVIYWTKLYFSLQYQSGLKVDSKIAFSQDDFFKAVSLWTKIGIYVGSISLVIESIKAIYNSVKSNDLVGGTVNVMSCFVSVLFATWLFSVSLVPFTNLDTDTNQKVWPVIHNWYSNVDSLEVVNSYGLFRRMTGVGGRPELVIEGTNDHVSGPWKEYHFHYKPGNISESPKFLFPHQPRLDWQMWFAALGTYQHNPWFIHLIYKLLHNEKDVLKLLSDNPFPNKAPKYIRSRLYTYHYTRISKHTKSLTEGYFSSRKIKKWWKRESPKEYTPPLHKDEPTLIEFVKNQKWFQKEKLKPSGIFHDILQSIRPFIETFTPAAFMWQVLGLTLMIRIKFWKSVLCLGNYYLGN